MKNLKKLTILHSNDLHGDFLAEQVDEKLVGGVSRLSGYVNKVRSEEKKPEEAVETPIEKKAPAKKVSQKKAPEKKPAPKKAPAKKSAPKKAAAATPTIILQSEFGGEVTAEQILSKVGDVDKVYVRIDQNKLYWVKGDEAGDKGIW